MHKQICNLAELLYEASEALIGFGIMYEWRQYDED